MRKRLLRDGAVVRRRSKEAYHGLMNVCGRQRTNGIITGEMYLSI